jgi:hypothetical protein
MDTKPLTVDGFLDTVPTPGDAPYTARFQLVVSPTDDVVDDVTWSCTTSKPGIVHALLTEIQPGDLLHVSGVLTNRRESHLMRTGVILRRVGRAGIGTSLISS